MGRRQIFGRMLGMGSTEMAAVLGPSGGAPRWGRVGAPREGVRIDARVRATPARRTGRSAGGELEPLKPHLSAEAEFDDVRE